MTYLIQCRLAYRQICAGVICDNKGIIFETAPVFKGWIGKHFRTMESWYIKNRPNKFSYTVIK